MVRTVLFYIALTALSFAAQSHVEVPFLHHNTRLVVETGTEGSDLTGEHFQVHINPEARNVSSHNYGKGGDYPNAKEAYRAAVQSASNRALVLTDEE